MYPLISIIIPNYNHGQYLKRSVLSALSQSWPNMQVIVVDDGSSDDSVKILKSMAKAFPEERLSVINIPHAGLSAARNAGIKAAKGEWITLLDSDDYLERDAVEVLYKNAVKYNANLAIGGHFVDVRDSGSSIVERGKKAVVDHRNDSVVGRWEKAVVGHRNDSVVGRWEKAVVDHRNDSVVGRWEKAVVLKPGVIDGHLHIHQFFQSREGRGHTFAWGKLYSAGLFKQISYPEGKVFEDIRVIAKICELTNRMAVCERPVYHYCLHKNTITYSNDIGNIAEGLTARVNNLKYYSKHYPEILSHSRAAVAEYSLYLMGRIWRERLISFWECLCRHKSGCFRKNIAHQRVSWAKLRKHFANGQKYNFRIMRINQCQESDQKNAFMAMHINRGRERERHWNRAVFYLRKYRCFLMKESPVYAIPCLISMISTNAAGMLCMVYSMLKNGLL